MKNHTLLISFAIFHISQNSVPSSFFLATQLLVNSSLNPSGKSHEKHAGEITFFLNFCFIVVQVQLSPFFPSPLPSPPQPSTLPTLDPTLLWFCPCVLYMCSWKPFLLFPQYPLPPPLSLNYFLIIILRTVLLLYLLTLLNF